MARRSRAATSLADRIRDIELRGWEQEAAIVRRIGLEVTWAKIADVMISGEGVESSNFSTGVSGWMIDGDGNAEFQDVTVRGVLIAEGGSDVDFSYISNVIIDTAEIADAAITTAKIDNLAVTAAKIGNAEVTSAKINDLAVSKLTGGTITAQTIILSDSASSILRSGDYSAGSAGWQILGNGNAEFNDVTIRGVLETGTIEGDLIVDGGKIATDSSGNLRLEFEAGGIKGYDASNNLLTTIFVSSGGLSINTDNNDDISFNLGNGGEINITGDVNVINMSSSTESVITKNNGTNLYIQNISSSPFSGDIYFRTYYSSAIRNRYHIDGDGYHRWFARAGSVVMQLTTDGTLLMTNGDATNPGIGLNTFTDTGFYAYTATTERIAFTVQGSLRAIITSGPTLAPSTDNNMGLGASGLRWTDVWAVDTTINSSDLDVKKNVKPINTKIALDLVKAIDPIQFKWKGGGKRWHWAYAAQQVSKALQKVGLDPADYGLYINPNINPKEPEDVDSPLALRSGELNPVILTALKDVIERLEVLEERAMNASTN